MSYLAKKPFLVIFILTFLFVLFFDKVFLIENTFIRSGLSAGIAVFLSPRKKKIKTQTGEKTQINWLFLKEPIILN